MATRTTASTILEIEVSQPFIDMATGQTVTRCPVALSLKGVDPNRIQRVKVDRNEISFSLTDHDIRYTFKTPAKVRNFIDAVDNGGRIAPFKFTLDTANAINAKPIDHPGARDLVQKAASRENPNRVPRASWAKRAVHAK